MLYFKIEYPKVLWHPDMPSEARCAALAQGSLLAASSRIPMPKLVSSTANTFMYVKSDSWMYNKLCRQYPNTSVVQAMQKVAKHYKNYSAKGKKQIPADGLLETALQSTAEQTDSSSTNYQQKEKTINASQVNETDKNVELIRNDYKVVEVTYLTEEDMVNKVTTDKLENLADGYATGYYYKVLKTETVAVNDVVAVGAAGSTKLAAVCAVHDADVLLEHEGINFKWVIAVLNYTAYTEALQGDQQLRQGIQKARQVHRRATALQSLGSTMNLKAFEKLAGKEAAQLFIEQTNTESTDAE